MQIGSTLDSVLFTLALVLIKSTSNHNKDYRHNSDFIVVSYRKTTSNHNFIDECNVRFGVVSYGKTTSNHNAVHGIG